MAKPFSPTEIVKESIDYKVNNIPDFVIQAVNELLVEKYRDGKAQFNQNEIMDRVLSKCKLERQEVFDKKYLDFEECFRKEGWKVTYYKGAYYEDWTPYFVFEVNSK